MAKVDPRAECVNKLYLNVKRERNMQILVKQRLGFIANGDIL